MKLRVILVGAKDKRLQPDMDSYVGKTVGVGWSGIPNLYTVVAGGPNNRCKDLCLTLLSMAA